MINNNAIPVLGVDSPAWLTTREDAVGMQHYYLASGTRNLRLNLPSENLILKPAWDNGEEVNVSLDVEFVSGMAPISKRDRVVDYLYACSHCAQNATVQIGRCRLGSQAAYIVDQGGLFLPSLTAIMVRLDASSIFDLANLYCVLKNQEYIEIAKKLPIGKGDLLTVICGENTCIVESEWGHTNAFYHSPFAIGVCTVILQLA